MVTKGVWWLWEVVTKGRGDEGKWLRREVWWLWEVVTKGVWWLWEVVTKGSGDEGKWWGREWGDFGKWWRRECGDKGKWWLREVVMKGMCKMHCDGCMNVAWSLCLEGSWSTKPCVFPCKVAAAGDERYLLCAAVAVWIVSRSIGSPSVFCNEWLFLCA